MRIISGKLKGTSLYLPKNKKTRPLRDLARENIFNLLAHSNKVLFQFKQSNILDLYAGVGSFGLECLSRQAENVCFVENEKGTVEILERNVEKLKLKNKTEIFFEDALNLIKKEDVFNLKFHLIFCDPPFKNTNIEKLVRLIYNKKLLKKNGILVLHRNKHTKEKLPNYFKILDERIYGVSKIIFGNFLY